MNEQKEVLTEVVSIASEEQRTGQSIPVPNAQNLVVQASSSLFRMRRRFNEILPTMSKKQILRAMNAILDLPTADLPVYLKTAEEKELFAVGQRAIMDRYTIITDHVIKEKQRITEELKAKSAADVAATTNQESATHE